MKISCPWKGSSTRRRHFFIKTFLTLIFCMVVTTFYQHLFYYRPAVGGILPEIFPDREILPYRYFSFDEEYRYPPINVSFPKILAELKQSPQTINLPILNEHPFRFIAVPKDVCKTIRKGKINLIIIVKSAVQHFDLRNVIRETWAKEARKSGVVVVFLIGYSEEDQHIVKWESLANNDIIQEDFVDSYLNNTYKTIMGFNWIALHCNIVEYVFFVDDDMFVNFQNLVHYISRSQFPMQKDLICGSLATRGIPVRDRFSKWYISWEDYPFDFYPPYLAGSSILTTIDVVERLQMVFPYIRPLPFDDVYLGIVLNKLAIRPQNSPFFDNTILKNIPKLKSLIANHGFHKPKLLRRTYEDIILNE